MAVGRSPITPALHEAVWVVVAVVSGGVAYAVTRRVGIERILVLAPLALAGSLVLLAAVMVPGVGASVGGASRWIPLGPFQLQPSELAKLALVLYLARLVTTRPRTRILGPTMVVTGVVAGAVFVEPDMGTAMVVGAIGIGALLVAQVPLRRIGAVLGAAAAVGALGALSSAYRRARLLSFLHPWRYRASLSYQEVQALGAFATSHLAGSGLGSGLANWGYVPNAPTDFVMTLVVQDFGVLGALVVLAALAAMVVGLLVAAERAQSQAVHVVLVLVAVWLAVQSVLNLGAVVGLLPVTGVPLPLVSQGGSSLVVVAMALGISLACAAPRRVRQ